MEEEERIKTIAKNTKIIVTESEYMTIHIRKKILQNMNEIIQILEGD